jgi:hypothetical protein
MIWHYFNYAQPKNMDKYMINQITPRTIVTTIVAMIPTFTRTHTKIPIKIAGITSITISKQDSIAPILYNPLQKI